MNPIIQSIGRGIAATISWIGSCLSGQGSPSINRVLLAILVWKIAGLVDAETTSLLQKGTLADIPAGLAYFLGALIGILSGSKVISDYIQSTTNPTPTKP